MGVWACCLLALSLAVGVFGQEDEPGEDESHLEKLLRATRYMDVHPFLSDAALRMPRFKSMLQRIIHQLEASADLDPSALGILGFLWGSGYKNERSTGKALEYFTDGADRDDPYSAAAMAYRYATGMGVEKSCETGLSLYRQALRSIPRSDQITIQSYAYGLDPPQDLLAIEMSGKWAGPGISPMAPLQFMDTLKTHYFPHEEHINPWVKRGQEELFGITAGRPDLTRAAEEFMWAHRQGDPLGSFYVAYMTMYGYGLEKNHETALSMFLAAAKEGVSPAASELANAYFNGYGTRRDLDKAADLMDMAVELGPDKNALYLMGQMEMRGEGFEQNVSSAFELWERAAEMGHPKACEMLSLLYEPSDEDKAQQFGTWGRLEVQTDCQRSLYYSKRALEVKLFWGLLSTAKHFWLHGRPYGAMLLYAYAAEAGVVEAQANYAYTLEKWDHMRREDPANKEVLAKAAIYYARASAQGNVHAKVRLADFYYVGRGIKPSKKEALRLYAEASDMGSPAGSYHLATLLTWDAAVKRDLPRASRLFTEVLSHWDDEHFGAELNLGWLQYRMEMEDDQQLHSALKAQGFSLEYFDALVRNSTIMNFALIVKGYGRFWEIMTTPEFVLLWAAVPAVARLIPPSSPWPGPVYSAGLCVQSTMCVWMQVCRTKVDLLVFFPDEVSYFVTYLNFLVFLVWGFAVKSFVQQWPLSPQTQAFFIFAIFGMSAVSWDIASVSLTFSLVYIVAAYVGTWGVWNYVLILMFWFKG